MADIPHHPPTCHDPRAAVCGLSCEVCSVSIATREDPKRWQYIATAKGLSLSEASCHGCRSENRYGPCATCFMTRCAAERGVAFCGDCPENPCDTLRQFQAAMPHRAELWESQALLREKGLAAWCHGIRQDYACPSCGTINSAYDLSCRACGHTPSCAFVERHEEKIRAHLGRPK